MQLEAEEQATERRPAQAEVKAKSRAVQQQQPVKPAAESTTKHPAKQPAKSGKVQRKIQAPAAGSADDLNNAYGNFFVACAHDTNLMKRKKCDQDPDCAKIEKQLI